MADREAGSAIKPAPENQGGIGLAIAGLTLTALLWGGMIPMTHAMVTQVFDPLFLAAIRYMVPAPLLLALCLLIDRASPFGGPMPWRHLIRLGALMACFSQFFTFGMLLSDPIRAAIVMSCSPLVATLLAKALYRTPLARGFALALAAAVIGGALVAVDAVRPRATVGQEGVPFIGEMLLFASMASWSLYSMKTQQWLAPLRWSQLRISFLTSLAGSCFVLSGFVGMELVLPGRLPTEWPSASVWFMLIWMAVGGAGIAIVLWNYGVSRVGVPVASLYGNMAPVFSVLVAALFFGAAVSPQQILGGLIILAGIVYMQWPRKRAMP